MRTGGVWERVPAWMDPPMTPFETTDPTDPTAPFGPTSS